MAYVTYTTQALVCGTFNRNTADGSYLLFTREAGMLYAEAKSIRLEKSKQRYALQDFSLVRVSLVRGKASWRVGSVESLHNYYHLAKDKTARGSVVSLFKLLRRFLKGEEAHSDIFDYVLLSLEELVLGGEQANFLSTMVQVKILAFLGYVDLNLLPAELKQAEPKDITEHYAPAVETRVNELYTHAVSISHL